MAFCRADGSNAHVKMAAVATVKLFGNPTSLSVDFWSERVIYATYRLCLNENNGEVDVVTRCLSSFLM